MRTKAEALEIDRAMEQASLHRLAASQMRQMGFKFIAEHHAKEARKAEKWAANAEYLGKGGE